MSTILKWAGNKTSLMPELMKHLPAGQRLVEPFAGSCAVMMATDYPRYLVADINPDLINMYRVIKQDTGAFLTVSRDCFERLNNPEDYYLIRERFNSCLELTDITRAAYFLYLNRHCHRGLCRYNKQGKFNTPYGHYTRPYFPKSEIIAFADKASRATFICASYDETLALQQAGDVVYCDPPYDGAFSQYHTAGFTDDDQYRLASILERRASEGYPIIVSNSDTSLTRSLYRNFKFHRVSAQRRMSLVSGDPRSAVEIIAVSQPKSIKWSGYDLTRGATNTTASEIRA